MFCERIIYGYQPLFVAATGSDFLCFLQNQPGLVLSTNLFSLLRMNVDNLQYNEKENGRRVWLAVVILRLGEDTSCAAPRVFKGTLLVC